METEFPTTFPVKVMGRQGSDLARIARDIVERHAGRLDESRISERPSAAGNFLALTFVIEAQSRQQLDAIYRELTACELVLMAL
jgi:putative lipoic acid-binding regulatory protein